MVTVIRTLRLRHGLAIREIARRTGLSRNTIKKHLKAVTIEPKFATPERQSKLDPVADKLAGWLKTEAGYRRPILSPLMFCQTVRCWAASGVGDEAGGYT